MMVSVKVERLFSKEEENDDENRDREPSSDSPIDFENSSMLFAESLLEEISARISSILDEFEVTSFKEMSAFELDFVDTSDILNKNFEQQE